MLYWYAFVCFSDNVRSYIGKLRQRRQGQGLSGLKLVDLKNQIIDLVLQDNRAPANMMVGNKLDWAYINMLHKIIYLP